MTITATKPRASIWTWPIRALWKLVTFLSNRIGIAASLGAGAILILIGFVLVSSVIGALIGVPILVLGILLFARGIY
ncbi:MAG: hypothetical protein HZB26_24425 [Candidatus Hydrogenedentes bacterium]|nr:hypothetical protein [Candidatus Hydrogenedentota bacterium]